MITLEEAWTRILAASTALPPVVLPLEEAADRWLASHVAADRDMPPHDRAAMDGFAVASRDLRDGPTTLRVAGEVAAGAKMSTPLTPGACLRIYTGANLPPGCDAVVPVEVTSQRTFSDTMQAEVTFSGPVESGAHIFKQGENGRQGDAILRTGSRLEAIQIGLCAAVGQTQVMVHGLPRVSILTTGAELVSSTVAAAVHQTRDSNGPLLEAALLQAGFPAHPPRRVPDDAAATVQALRQSAGQAEVVIITGGVSAGRHDYVPGAMAALATIHYHGVAMKPGKPQLFAASADGTLFFGLPGNPVSALCGLHEFILPTLRRLAGCLPEACRPCWRMPLASPVKGRADRQRLMMARLVTTQHGLSADPVSNRGSADLVAAAMADGVIVLPCRDVALSAGDQIDFRPWRSFR